MLRSKAHGEGDGAGYDIESFAPEGRENYCLYRVYGYEDSRNAAWFYVGVGDVEEMFELMPTQYRATRN